MLMKSIWLGIGVGLLFWLGDSARACFNEHVSFFNQILNPAWIQIEERLMVITPLSIFSAIYMNFWMRKTGEKLENILLNEESYKQILENTDKVFWLTDTGKHRMIYINPACEKIFGSTPEKLYRSPRSWLDAIHPDDRNRIIEATHMKQTQGEYNEEYRIIKPDGSVRWIHETAYPVRNPLGNVYRIAGIAEEITGQTERGKMRYQENVGPVNPETKKNREIVLSIERQLSGQKSRAFFDSLIKSITDYLKMDYGFIGELVENNRHVKMIAVFAGGQPLPPFEYSLAKSPCETVADTSISIYTQNVSRLFPDASLFRKMEAESYIGTALFDSGGQPIGLIVLMGKRPMSDPGTAESVLQTFVVRTSIELERKRLEEALQWMEYHDPVTGFPNQIFFFDSIKNAVRQGESHHEPFAVVLTDLNNFKEFNKTFGFHQGNALLQKVGKRFEEILGEADSVARIGGDEFGLILPRATAEKATRIASRILNCLNKPFEIGDQPVYVGAKIGRALYPDDGKFPETLLLKAEIALYTSQEVQESSHAEGGDSDETENPAVKGDIFSYSKSTFRELLPNLENGELFLAYQPRVELDTGRVTGVEALIRWRHPKHGIIPAGQFFSTSGNTEVMKRLNLFVLKEAMNQCRIWNESGRKIHVAVNLALQNLLDHSLPDQIETLLQTCDVNPKSLEIEIAESILKHDRGNLSNAVVQISRKGIGVTLDNFGFIASSIDYLKQLPIHSIKIDRSYVTDAIDSPDHAMVVKSAIEFAHDQGLKVIAVGVEDQKSLDQLVTFGCDEAQGFYIGRPVLSEELTPWIDESFRDQVGVDRR